MKNKDDILKVIKSTKRFIENYKEQIKHHMDDDFDIEKIEEFSRKINLLDVELRALEWVLDEN